MIKSISVAVIFMGMAGAAGAQEATKHGAFGWEFPTVTPDLAPAPCVENCPGPSSSGETYWSTVQFGPVAIVSGDFSVPDRGGPVNDDFIRGACWAAHALYSETRHTTVTFSGDPSIECPPVGLKK